MVVFVDQFIDTGKAVRKDATLVRALIDLMAGAYENKGFEAIHTAMPIEILVGGDDPCAGGENGARKGREFLKSAGFTRASYTVYPGMRHELHNEPEGERAVNDMVNQLLAWA